MLGYFIFCGTPYYMKDCQYVLDGGVRVNSVTRYSTVVPKTRAKGSSRLPRVKSPVPSVVHPDGRTITGAFVSMEGAEWRGRDCEKSAANSDTTRNDNKEEIIPRDGK